MAVDEYTKAAGVREVVVDNSALRVPDLARC